MSANPHGESGFTLVEALVSVGLVLTVTAGVISLLNPARGVFKAQPDAAEMQQRMRVAVDVLMHDLMMAGAGASSGELAGPLVNYLPPIVPSARLDAITIVYVSTTASQTTLDADAFSGSRSIVVGAESGCPRDPSAGGLDRVCGFRPGARAVIFDSTGAFDLFTVTSADPATATLSFEPLQSGSLSKAYQGSSSKNVTKVAEVSYHVYYLNQASKQLMHDDGTVSPVLDNIVALAFEYYGDPRPPVFLNPGKDQTVSYGPRPPALDVVQPPFAAGENCTWQVNGRSQTTRLVPLAADNEGLVPLSSEQLTDGPWCPDDVSPNRYDADLLRVRKVRVTLRLQVGASPRTVRFDVSPRNMNLGR